MAKKKALDVLNEVKVESKMDRDTLINVSRTSLRTKTPKELSDNLTEIVVDAVLAIRQENRPIDLHMVEIMEMTHKTDSETKLVRGIVMDHGARHPDMKRRLTMLTFSRVMYPSSMKKVKSTQVSSINLQKKEKNW
eukprot:TRINITY_DN2555_c0_g1_i1.p1 TRINITY_DN2555_c0_g1~~TRINITY_DN2555_c0_g1_i1.p1  ORF type:complete len:149 (-),score=27.56 TRINITY_DN2555_c0_g1_i1:50-457(-)